MPRQRQRQPVSRQRWPAPARRQLKRRVDDMKKKLKTALKQIGKQRPRREMPPYSSSGRRTRFPLPLARWTRYGEVYLVSPPEFLSGLLLGLA